MFKRKISKFHLFSVFCFVVFGPVVAFVLLLDSSLKISYAAEKQLVCQNPEQLLTSYADAYIQMYDLLGNYKKLAGERDQKVRECQQLGNSYSFATDDVYEVVRSATSNGTLFGERLENSLAEDIKVNAATNEIGAKLQNLHLECSVLSKHTEAAGKTYRAAAELVKTARYDFRAAVQKELALPGADLSKTETAFEQKYVAALRAKLKPGDSNVGFCDRYDRAFKRLQEINSEPDQTKISDRDRSNAQHEYDDSFHTAILMAH